MPSLYFSLVFKIAAMACLLLQADFALAADLPWEEPLEKVTASLTGPVASTIAIIGIFIAGATLIFGGDLTGLVKRICLLVIAISLAIAGGGLITRLFGGGGSGALL